MSAPPHLWEVQEGKEAAAPSLSKISKKQPLSAALLPSVPTSFFKQKHAWETDDDDVAGDHPIPPIAAKASSKPTSVPDRRREMGDTSTMSTNNSHQHQERTSITSKASASNQGKNANIIPKAPKSNQEKTSIAAKVHKLNQNKTSTNITIPREHDNVKKNSSKRGENILDRLGQRKEEILEDSANHSERSPNPNQRVRGRGGVGNKTSSTSTSSSSKASPSIFDRLGKKVEEDVDTPKERAGKASSLTGKDSVSEKEPSKPKISLQDLFSANWDQIDNDLELDYSVNPFIKK